MGEKIKIKDIEGDSEEVIRLFSSSDCSLSEYLNANKPIKIPLIAIGILVVVFLLSTASSGYFQWNMKPLVRS